MMIKSDFIYPIIFHYNEDMERDLRKYDSQTRIRAFLLFLVILFVVGDGLIWLFYGSQNAIFGALCMLGGLIPVGLIFLILTMMGWIVHRYQDE